MWNFSFRRLVRAIFNISASVKVKCVDTIYSCLEKGCQKKCIRHATRRKGTVGNDEFKLFLTPAFQVNVRNVMTHQRYMFASIKER